ncbi:MAG: CHAT domain-containing protein, partial [Armatimonadota bacterium]|nr:CHAT domain-containing protein [Armatimonadota bacterium]
MHRLEIVDLGSDRIQVAWRMEEGAQPFASEGHDFAFPMEPEDRAELRWYLEDFLSSPWGAYQDRAERVARKMTQWGEELFERVFRADPRAHECYIRAVNEGVEGCLLSVVSSDPAFAGQPWELLRDPDRGFVAVHLGGFARSRRDVSPAAEPDFTEDSLHILMVTARPGGKEDIRYRMVARPMLAALGDSDVPITVELLRPPTFDALARRLGERPRPHVVHFDGHGYFPVEAQELGGGFFEADLTGILCFERAEPDEDGDWADPVKAEEIGELLRECGVALFVLNACRSAIGPDEVTEAGSSVAHELVRTGARAVVAMNFSVHAHTAARFVARFYAELLRGRSVAGAVAEAREALMADPERPARLGMRLDLQDWIVPVLFQQRDYVPLPEASTRERTLREFAAEVAEAAEAGGGEVGEEVPLDGFPEPGRYGFIGRDGDVLMLERLMRRHDAVLVWGMAGIGKSSLARHFAEWLRETVGIDAAFFISFEQGGSRQGVLGQVGRAVMGLDFSRPPPEQQEQVALRILRERRSLLVWDNFESVRGFPTEEFAVCDAEEQEALQQLLRELAGSKCTVLITSRRKEDWVGAYGLYELEGLPAPDAYELAGEVLAQHGIEAAEVGQDLEELIEELGYHPLVLQAVLPRLRETT